MTEKQANELILTIDRLGNALWAIWMMLLILAAVIAS